MSVDLTKKRINFGIDVKKGDETTSHLENPENIVVLECVDRLLKKGYKPSDLTLEKKWKLGRTAKSGKADITVLDKKGKTLLIIECKTWGVEYEKELKNMKNNGGQLISYFQQDKNTRFLCLYASRLNKGKIQMENSILNVDDHIDEILKQREVDSLITYENQQPVGQDAAVRLLGQIQEQFEKPGVVIIAGKNSEEGRAFVSQLQVQLTEAGWKVEAAIAGSPIDLGKALRQADGKKVSVNLLACEQSFADSEKEGVPIEEKVADILLAIIPLLPTPQSITFD